MAQHVAFLRAINVGRRLVKMEALRAHCEALGFSNVRTFIASGNVIFEAAGKAAALETRLEQHLAATLGYEVETFIRSVAELRAIAADVEARFAAELTAGSKVYVGFLRELPGAAYRSLTEALSTAEDVLTFGKREVYWLSHGSMADTKITVPRLHKALGAPLTARNITALRKLIATFD